MTKFVHFCPRCRAEIVYRSRQWCERAEIRGTLCTPCRVAREQAAKTAPSVDVESLTYEQIKERMRRRARVLIWGDPE